MKNKTNMKMLILPLLALPLALSSACKQIGEESSELMTDAGNKEVDNKPVEQFNLAEWIVKKGIGGANFKNNVVGNKYIRFHSNEEEKPDAANKKEAAASKNKASLLKPEYELRTNATVTSDSKKAEIKMLFFLDGYLNGARVYPAGNTVEIMMLANAKTSITAKGNAKAFGKELYTKTVNATGEFKISKSVNLEAKATVLGIPKIAGVSAGVSFVATAAVTGETDSMTTEAVSVSMSPTIKVTAGIEGKVSVLGFAEATAKGTVTVLDAQMPASATLAGRLKSGADYLAGNVTFAPLTFTAVKGDIVIGAKASTKGALPKGIEAAIWSPNSAAMMSSLINKLDLKWEWVYKVWDSPSLINVKWPAPYTSSFLVSAAMKDKAACATPALTKAIALMTKENAKDTNATKKVGSTAITALKAIQAKEKTAKKSCAVGGAAKPAAGKK